MTGTETTKKEPRSIHPDPTGPTHAESPYSRKLRRLMEDVKMTESVAPLDHKGVLSAMIFELEALLRSMKGA